MSDNEGYKICHACKEEINADATKCKYCQASSTPGQDFLLGFLFVLLFGGLIWISVYGITC